jgi:hypothetical protein
MEGFRRVVAVTCAALSASAAVAHADGPIGLSPLNGPDNATLLQGPIARDPVAFSFGHALTPWLRLDFAHGSMHASDVGNPAYLGTRMFNQAGATFYPGRNWNATLFVNSFRADTTTQDQGVQVSNASFVNARLNRDFSSHMRLSFDVVNVFDKRVDGIDRLASPRLWTEPLVSENVLFDASESRGFRLRLRLTF